jgi:hypothetical protein
VIIEVCSSAASTDVVGKIGQFDYQDSITLGSWLLINWLFQLFYCFGLVKWIRKIAKVTIFLV